MGKDTFTRTAYRASTRTHVPKSGPATRVAEQRARETGTLNPLVDPKGLPQYGPVRPSRIRFEEQPNGLWMVTIGLPVPSETRVDTTGSMGGNVDVALRVLPHSFELVSKMLPGCDLQIATGIFGDAYSDKFVLCRPQFEMLAAKIVQQLTLMVPERSGGDRDEDPDYGLFAGAYLTDAYANRIGLKGYDFTVSDAPGRGHIQLKKLLSVFGDDVIERMAVNGHQMDPEDLPSTKQIVRDLLKRAHAFFLQVGGAGDTSEFWKDLFGPDRVVRLPSTEVLPQVQAAIVGLTEGTLALTGVNDFLTENGLDQQDAARVTESVSNIPIGAQAALENFGRRPKAGDLFRSKTDLWPLRAEELTKLDIAPSEEKPEAVDWI
jgi:hypothetical protein